MEEKMHNQTEGRRWVRRLLLYLLTAAAVVLVDLFTKYLASSRLKPIGDYPLIQGVLHLTYSENTGAAFGMLKDHRWVFLVSSTLFIAVIGVYLVTQAKKLHPLLGIALAFIMGGGIGNMIDRLTLGYVVDFINFELIHFAIFNAADSFVCIGAAMMVLYVLFFEIKESKKDG